MFKDKEKKIVLQRLTLPRLMKIIVNKETSQRKKNQCLFEITRRFYLALGPLFLTLVGLAWSIDIGRRSSIRYKVILFILIFLYFVIYLLSKSLKNDFLIASLLFMSTIAFIFSWSRRHIMKIEEGYETCL